MNIYIAKMISSYFNALRGIILLGFVLFAPQVTAAKANFATFCVAVAGDWRGSAARAGESPQQVSVSALCTADKRQLLLSVSQSAKHWFSETWWFRARGDEVHLTYFDGVDEDKQQTFSLYQIGDGYSLLGQGQLNKRPALIQLLFESKAAGWQWRQNVQYLDDDVEHYLLFRGIDMQPSSSSVR